MHVAVLAHRGAVPEDVGATLDLVEELILPFHPAVASRDSWVGHAHHTRVWSWGNGPESIPAGLARDERAAVCLSGYALRSGALVTPEELLATTAGPGADEYRSGLGGAFSIVRATEDRIQAWNTPARLEQVYWARGGGVTVVSSRALAAHLVAERTRRPTYDPDFIRSFLMAGFPATNKTPFRGVSLLPSASRLEVSREKVEVRSLPSVRSSQSAEESISRLHESFVESVRFIADIDPEPKTALTGGKDSRLVAAVMADAGVPFTAITRGLAEHPDVIVARDVAQTLGVRHTETDRQRDDSVDRPTSVDQDVIGVACRRLLNSDGAHSVFEFVSHDGRRGSSGSVLIGGQGGEVLRGGYATKTDVSHGDNWSVLAAKVLRHRAHLGTRAGTAERLRLVSWFASNSTWSSSPLALWDHYLEFRTGRWAAAGWAATSVTRPVVWPFYDAAVVRATERVDIARRIDERALADVIGRARPELLSIPLVGARFAFEARGPVDGGESAWRAREPLKAVEARARFDWRFHFSSGLGRLMTETIEPAIRRDEVGSVVNVETLRDLMTAAVEGRIDGNRSDGYYLWTVFSIGLLLSDLWLEPDPPTGRIRFPLPA